MTSGLRIFPVFAFAVLILAAFTLLGLTQKHSRVVRAAGVYTSVADNRSTVNDPYCDSAHYDLQPVIDRSAWWAATGSPNSALNTVSSEAGIVFRPANATAQTFDVGVGQFAVAFEPSSLTITVGDTVRWTWFGGPHSVNSGNTNTCTTSATFCAPNDTNCTSNPTFNTGTVYTHMFNQPGVYTYFCKPHCSGGMKASITVNAVQARATLNDFDGDGKADLMVFRPADGNWYQTRSSDNTMVTRAFGIAGDQLAPADYDGDQKADIGIFRSGAWYAVQSTNGSTRSAIFGQAGDLPVASDFDGDGKADYAVFRPGDGAWYILQSSNNAFRPVAFGLSSDRPLIADFDADGKSDIAVFRSSTGVWYYLQSSDGSFHGVAFGAPGDKPVPGDFDGDGKTDLAVFRPSEGNWYSLQSTGGFRAVNFGLNNDIPVPADYDGDGKTDVGVFRGGNWYQLLSTNGSFRAIAFGNGGDQPSAAANIP